MTLAELMKIGAGLGADVPFFFLGGRGLAEGTGTRVSSCPDAVKQHLIVVTPNVAVSTISAYQALNAPSLTTNESDFILTSSFADPSLSDCDHWALHNDFEVVIFEIEPEIKRVKQALLDAGAHGALLAGSGSSVFGVFDSEVARDRALGDLRCEAGWRIFSCETLAREEYRQRIGSSEFPALCFL